MTLSSSEYEEQQRLQICEHNLRKTLEKRDREIKRLQDWIEKIINIFDEYRPSFGLSLHDELERACEYEDKFAELICELNGHDIGPDQCGIPEHDYCYFCNRLKVDIENDRKHESK